MSATLRLQKYKDASLKGTNAQMPQSLVKILVHIVFSTKNRVDSIPPEIESDLFAYIHGIIENNKSKMIAANGTTNHIHLLVSMGKTVDASDLVGDIKRDSSKWIKKQSARFENFYWQEGYGAFSIGQSQVESVVQYIRNQKQHHASRDFKTEFRRMLQKYEVEFDEQFVWD